jgi:ferredoxin-NADP reductase
MVCSERFKGPIDYVAGPPAMVTAMGQMPAAAGVDEDEIRTEEFAATEYP